MAIGSGLGSSIGMAVESTYGTYATPTRWHEMDGQSYPFKKMPNYAQSSGMASDALVKRAARRVMTHEWAEGSFSTEVLKNEMGRLINLAMGGTVTPTQIAATTAYEQTHPLADTFDNSATFQIGVPQTDGTVNPHTFLGSKVKSIEISCERGGLLTAAFEWDCRQFTEAETLQAVSYTTGLAPFHFVQGTVKLGTFGSEAAVGGVRKMSVKIERAMNTERFNFGNSGLKDQPILNAPTAITGSLEVDYESAADFADRFHGNTPTSLVWLFEGDDIEAGNLETFRVTIPSTFFTGDTPTIEGHDVVNTTFNFEGDDDETNDPAEIYIISTDTTL